MQTDIMDGGPQRELTGDGPSLKELRKGIRPKVGQADIAAKLGITASQYSRLENSPETMSGRQLCVVSEVLGLPVDVILGHRQAVTTQTVASLVRAVPVFEPKELSGEGMLGPEWWASVEYETYWHQVFSKAMSSVEGRRTLQPRSQDVSNEAIWITCEDDAMSPFIKKGDDVLIDRKAKVKPGDMVAAYAPVTGEIVFRRYSPFHPTDPRGPGYLLTAEGKSFGDIIATNTHPGRIIGRIVESRTSF